MSPLQSEKASIQTHSKESSSVSYMEFDEEEEEVWLFLQFSFYFVIFLFAAFTTKYVSRKSMYAAV